MTQENIRKIADSLPHHFRYSRTGVVLWGLDNSSIGIFNPYENEADAFKVLEALVKKCDEKNIEMSLSIGNMRFLEHCGEGRCLFITNARDGNLKHAICSAFISLIERGE